MNKVTVHAGIGLMDVLLVAFIVLKLTHVIDWGWGWVLTPLWIPIAILVIYVAVMVWLLR